VNRRAWAEPGVQAVGEGVFRLPLPLPDAGLHAVNAYVLLDGSGPVVIDPGQATDEGWDALEAAFDELGLKPGDVTRVLVTHIHRDHYNAVGRSAQTARHADHAWRGRKEVAGDRG